MGKTVPRRFIKAASRRRLKARHIAVPASVLLLLAACLAMPPTFANAASEPVLDDVLGISRQQYVSSIERNWSSSYEGTPYEGWYLNEQLYPSWNDGMFWPRGNPSPTGHVGMNCGGFVSRTIVDAGADDYNCAFMADWWNGAPNAVDGYGAAAGHYANARTFWRLAKTYGLEMYEFSNKWDLLASGRAVKGDIIVMIDDVDAGGYDDYGRYHEHAQDSHIGVFWGDTPDDDKFLHAAHDIAITAETEVSGCTLSTIQPKCWGSRFYLVKFRDYGGIELAKKSALPEISDGNANYSLEGAVYGVFTSRSDAEKHDAASALSTHTTDKNGTWSTGRAVDPGTYYVAETTAPAGFALDGAVYEVQVTAGADTQVNGGEVQDVPQSEKPSGWALKRDAETSDGKAQGEATLAGAQFEVCYYDGYYDEDSLPASATRTWLVETDANGVARADDALKVSGDEFYRDESGSIVIPLGTVTVRETKAPAGYRLGESELHIANIKSTGSAAGAVNPFAAPTVADYVQRGGVAVGKVDRQHMQGAPQGSATLAGAVFEVASANDRPVVVDGAEYDKGAVITTITTEQGDAGFVARTAADLLPIGSYTVREIETSTGYLLDAESKSWRGEFSIDQDGQVADLTSADDSVPNLVIRGDFEFSKVDGLDMGRMAGVPFMLTSQTTGESHVVVTDENGMLSTAASWNAHSYKTNANDAAISYRSAAESSDAASESETTQASEDAKDGSEGAASPSEEPELLRIESEQAPDAAATTQNALEEEPAVTEDASPASQEQSSDTEDTASAPGEAQPTLTVDESLLDPAAGVWFSGRADASCEADDELGALPFDTYTVTELPVSANAGYELVSFDVTITRNARELDLGTVDDELIPDEPEEPTPDEPAPTPEIGTTLTDAADDDHAVAPSDTVTLVDTIAYSGLEPGKQYLAQGMLHLRSNDGSDSGTLVDVAGEEVTAHATFVPDFADGTVDVEFTFSAADLGSRSLVAFEQVSCEGDIVAKHEDISDEGQTVKFDEETPPAPDQPEKTPPTPDKEQPREMPTIGKSQSAGTLPVLGDPVLTAALVALVLALLSSAIAIVCFGKARRTASEHVGAHAAAAGATVRRTPTYAPRVRDQRQIRIERGRARRE